MARSNGKPKKGPKAKSRAKERTAFEVVLAALEKSGLSNAELARRSGVSRPQISRIRSGGVLPRLDTAEKLGRTVGLRLMAVATEN